MLVSSLLLLFFQEKSHTLGLFLSCLAMGCVLLLRSEYHKAIFQNLVANAIRFEKKAIDWIATFTKREIKEVEVYLLSKLRKAEESTQLLAYEYLLKIDNARLLPRLLNQFSKLSIPGKIKAIDLLSESGFAKENVVIDYLERWRRLLPHPTLKSSIHFYFAKHAHLRPESVLPYLQNDHLGLRAAAILSLKTTSSANAKYADLATTKLSHLLHSTDDAEIAMGLVILGFDPREDSLQLILSYFSHPSLAIRKEAAKALIPIAHAAEKSVTDFLVSQLPFIRDVELRNLLLDALLKVTSLDSIRPLILSTVHFRPLERKKVESIVLSVGKECVADLLELLCDAKIHVRCRLLAGRILGKLSLKDLRIHLYPLVQEEIQRAYFYYYHAHESPMHSLAQDTIVLQSALLTGYESIIDFIIQLLGVAGSLEESEVLSHTLRSKNRKIRAHAIETLERTCDPRIFSLLEPLLDDKNPTDKLHAFLNQGGIALSTYELLEKLAQSGSRADQIVSLTFSLV